METITRTDRLILIPLSGANLDEAHKVYGDPRIWKHRPKARHEDIRTTMNMVSVAQDSWAHHHYGPWAAYLRHQPSEFVGVGGAEFVSGGSGFWDIKYRLRPTHWGVGFATEISRAALESLRRVDPDSPITIRVTTNHPASIRVVDKLGLEQVWQGRRVGTEGDDSEPDVRVYADRDLPADVLDYIKQRP